MFCSIKPDGVCSYRQFTGRHMVKQLTETKRDVWLDRKHEFSKVRLFGYYLKLINF